jgi:hypothetical protein
MDRRGTLPAPLVRRPSQACRSGLRTHLTQRDDARLRAETHGIEPVRGVIVGVILGIDGRRSHRCAAERRGKVAPPFDHARVTGVAASHVAFELLGLFARRSRDPTSP